MIKDNWKRFNFYEKFFAAFFIINLFLDVLNRKLLNSSIPSEIVGYLFWLSLGLYLGFQLCKYEYKRVWNKMQAQQKQGKDKKMPSGYSPN